MKEKDQNKYYTFLGDEDFIDEDGFPRLKEESKQVYAKCSLSQKPKHIVSNTNLGVDKTSYKYYIATNANKQAYNPNDANQPKGSFIDNVCKDSTKFQQVNQYIFEKYIKFLITKNDGWIREINRDLN